MLKRFLYLIPATVSATTSVLAVLCLYNGKHELDRIFPGFFFHANGTVASMQRAGWEGPKSGIRPGDTVLSINDHPIPGGASLNHWLSQRHLGEVVNFKFRRLSDNSIWQTPLRLRQLTTADILATFVLPYSIGVIFLLLGSIIFFLKRSYEAALALSICIVAAIFYMTTFDAHTSHHYVRLWSSYPLLGAVSIHLFSVFPEKRPIMHRTPSLTIPYTIAAGILTFIQLKLYDDQFTHSFSLLSSSFLTLCFVVNIWLLTVTSVKGTTEAIQNKAKTIRAGLMVTAAAGVVWSLMVRIYPELITAEGAMMLSALFPILLAYAVIKKNLFDMDFVLRTTTIYAVATVMVVALYFAVVFVIGLAMSAWTRRYMGFLQNVETVVISTLVVALIFHPLRLGVQRVIDRYFFRAQSVLQEELSRLGKELAAMTTHFPSLAQHLTEHVQKLMRSRYVVLLSQSSSRRVFHNVAKAGTIPTALEGLAIPAEHPMIQFLSEHNELLLQWEPNDRWLKSDIADLLISAEFTILVPLRTATTLAGVLILGRRQQGDVFNRFDLNALRSMALPAALALENSLLLREHAERERLAALGKFSAVMIHEIKNPLGIIRVSSGTLKKRFDPSDSGYELSSFIEEEVVRMNQTIAQFLTFARPSQPKLTRIELAELVRRTASAMQENLKEAGIQLELEIDSPMPVMADGDQVQQVLLNLLVNARQALEEREGGKVAITLRRLPVKSSPLMAELKVKDNGSGIDPSIMDRIFEPFFTTRRGGTGLGLAIARQLLNEQGGRIEVRSDAIGTEFTVTLPAIQVTAPSSSS